MTILYFAHARRLAGCAEETLAVGEALSPDELWTALLTRHPELAELRASSRLACNRQFAVPGMLLQPGDEIAIIPPVSGG